MLPLVSSVVGNRDARSARYAARITVSGDSMGEGSGGPAAVVGHDDRLVTCGADEVSDLCRAHF